MKRLHKTFHEFSISLIISYEINKYLLARWKIRYTFMDQSGIGRQIQGPLFCVSKFRTKVAQADKFRGHFFGFASSWTKVAQADKLKDRQCILLLLKIKQILSLSPFAWYHTSLYLICTQGDLSCNKYFYHVITYSVVCTTIACAACNYAKASTTATCSSSLM